MVQAAFSPEVCRILNLLEAGSGVLYLGAHDGTDVVGRCRGVCCFGCLRWRGRPRTAAEHDALVAKHAAAHGVPEALVRRVIHIETKGNPRLVSKGNYGLMQIRLGTARAMGYGGGADGLLDADTNMTYAVKYLAGAYRAAGGNHERAIRNYQKGYYYEAKRQGFTPYTVASAVPAGAAAPDPTHGAAGGEPPPGDRDAAPGGGAVAARGAEAR